MAPVMGILKKISIMMGVLEDASFPLKHIFKNLNLAHWLPPDDLRESIFFLASWIGYASAHLLPLYFHVFKIFLILDIWIYLFFWSFLLNCFFILLPTSNPVVTLLRFFFLLLKTSLVEFVQRSFLLMCPWRPLHQCMGVGPSIVCYSFFRSCS